MYSINPGVSGYLIAASALLIVLHLRKKRRQFSYPPGPKPLPFVGNAFEMPRTFQWLTYADWTRRFDSDVIYLNAFGTDIIVLGSYKAAFEILDKRSVITADRPRFPMLTELMGLDWTFALFRYGQKWRTQRRLFHHHFNSDAISVFEPQQIKHAHKFLEGLVESPEKFYDHIFLFTSSLILSLSYGVEVTSYDDPHLVRAQKVFESGNLAARPDGFLVDVFPILKYVPEWFPGAEFQRIARKEREFNSIAPIIPFQLVKDQMAKGIAPSSILSRTLTELTEYDEETIQHVTAVIYVAATDSTASAIRSFFLAMVLFPGAARKAQEELDRVIGRDRLPEFSDRSSDSLPYVFALIKEVLRWNPVFPLGFPHRLMADDVYEGKMLPAGATIIVNQWALLHDERDYKDPMLFNPDRFLKNGKLNPSIRPPEDIAFGFGRRICAGLDTAMAQLFIIVTSVLSTLDITNAVHENGSPVVLDPDYLSGMISHPVPFKCSIRPRSQQSLELIEHAIAAHD